MITMHLASQHPPSRNGDINRLKIPCGCPCGGAIKNILKNGLTRIPLTLRSAGVYVCVCVGGGGDPQECSSGNATTNLLIT